MCGLTYSHNFHLPGSLLVDLSADFVGIRKDPPLSSSSTESLESCPSPRALAGQPGRADTGRLATDFLLLERLNHSAPVKPRTGPLGDTFFVQLPSAPCLRVQPDVS